MKNSEAPNSFLRTRKARLHKNRRGRRGGGHDSRGRCGADEREGRGLVGRKTRQSRCRKTCRDRLPRALVARALQQGAGRPWAAAQQCLSAQLRSRKTHRMDGPARRADALPHALRRDAVAIDFRGTGAHLAQIINDTGIEVHKKHPDRFVIGIELPICDPQLALEGIESHGRETRA